MILLRGGKFTAKGSYPIGNSLKHGPDSAISSNSLLFSGGKTVVNLAAPKRQIILSKAKLILITLPRPKNTISSYGNVAFDFYVGRGWSPTIIRIRTVFVAMLKRIHPYLVYQSDHQDTFVCVL
jgi:hypothetical protein